MTTPDLITETVRTRYATLARQAAQSEPASCCDSDCCGGAGGDSISVNLYSDEELAGLPLRATLASLGCGNPTAVATLLPGEVVLDLGSGGGIDVLLSARRVGPTGHAYGLDMTDEMLALARRNRAEAGVDNATFLRGNIAAIPLPDNSVDVIISNCVINLAPDKTPVFAEAFRVLKPGGRLAVSDIVIHGGAPGGTNLSAVDLTAWAGCVAGALTDDEYRDGLAAAGFEAIELEVSRRYTRDDLPRPLPAWAAPLAPATLDGHMAHIASTIVRAQKPS